MKEKPIKVKMGEETVRFMPDGKIFVKDAIEFMNPEGKSHDIWKRITTDHPEILDYCQEFHSVEEETLPLIDSEGWDRIIDLVPEYLFGDETK